MTEFEQFPEVYRKYRENHGINDPVILNEIEEACYQGMLKIIKDAKSGIADNEHYIHLDDGTWIDLDPSMQLNPAFNFKPGDKVKIIIIKDE